MIPICSTVYNSYRCIRISAKHPRIVQVDLSVLDTVWRFEDHSEYNPLKFKYIGSAYSQNPFHWLLNAFLQNTIYQVAIDRSDSDQQVLLILLIDSGTGASFLETSSLQIELKPIETQIYEFRL